jgi:hypothetical protein
MYANNTYDFGDIFLEDPTIIPYQHFTVKPVRAWYRGQCYLFQERDRQNLHTLLHLERV